MRTLLVEDDVSLGAALERILSQDGQQVAWVRTATAGRDRLLAEPHHLMLLDVGLPDGNGLELLRWLRGRDPGLPVLVMAVRASVEERSRGLDAGADDYLAKPFEIDELRARIRALMRRTRAREHRSLRLGPFEIDPARRLAVASGRRVTLSPRETDLLMALATDPGAVLTRRQLADAIGAEGEQGSNAVDVHVHNLRAKIGRDRILTVRGVGYGLRHDD